MKRRIVFAGDSIIHGGPWQFWLPHHYVTNFAFPGHTTSDLTALIDDIVDSQPELLIVMIGTNDFGKYRLPIHQVIENVLGNAREIRAKLPDVPIIWHALTPRNGEFSQGVVEVNQVIRPVLEDLGILYFDTYELLRDENEGILKFEYCSDPDTFGLHLTNAGYEAWFKALSPEITLMLEDSEDQEKISTSLRGEL